MDLAIISETEGWRIGAITNQLYVGRAWSGSDSFTAPVILMEWTVLHCLALQPLSHQMYGNQGSLKSSKLCEFPLVFCTLVSILLVVRKGVGVTIQYSHPEFFMLMLTYCLKT